MPTPSGGTRPLIRAESAGVSLAGNLVLRDVDLEIEPGEIVTVVGPNGSGKTTLVRMLVGAIDPDRGRVTRRPGLRIGYVPQRLAIDSTMPLTVERFLGVPHRYDRGEMITALRRCGVDDLRARQLTAVSGGQFQRVLLARALLGQPDILVLDEPTQGLDQPGTASFYRLLEEVRREFGCAVLLVGHDLHVVMSASDRVICLNGHICCQGTPNVVSAAPEYRALFGHGTRGALALYQHSHDHDHDHAAARHDTGPDRAAGSSDAA